VNTWEQLDENTKGSVVDALQEWLAIYDNLDLLHLRNARIKEVRIALEAFEANLDATVDDEEATEEPVSDGPHPF